MDRNMYKELCGYPLGSLSRTRLFSLSKDNVSFMQRFQLMKKLKVHNGCVNTVCWNDSGQVLLSGSDDRYLTITDPYTAETKYKVLSGHHSNIFSAKFLPNTNDKHIISCSGDGLITFTDLENAETRSGYNYNSFDCHFGTVYEVVTVPGDRHSFLSCGEDGTVRWFDLRGKDRCVKSDCTEDVLINCRRAVTSLAVNPLLPWQLSVGCSDGTVVMYDRRKLTTRATGGTGSNRNIDGMVSRFSAPSVDGRNLRITSLTYSDDAEEVLVSYSTDHVYLFNIKENGKAKKLSTDPEDCEDEEGTIPPVKRLRLRGDWSDTGPNALPERERGSSRMGNTAQNIMQRMSDMLTRWLEEAAYQQEASGQPNETEAEGQGHESTIQGQSDTASENVNRRQLEAVRGLNFGGINIESTPLSKGETAHETTSNGSLQSSNPSEDRNKSVGTQSVAGNCAQVHNPSTSCDTQLVCEVQDLALQGNGKHASENYIAKGGTDKCCDLQSELKTGLCEVNVSQIEPQIGNIETETNRLETSSNQTEVESHTELRISQNNESSEIESVCLKSRETVTESHSQHKTNTQNVCEECTSQRSTTLSCEHVPRHTEQSVEHTNGPHISTDTITASSSFSSETALNAGPAQCPRDESDLKDLHRMVHKLRSQSMEPTVSLTYSSQGASTSQIRFHFSPKPSTSNDSSANQNLDPALPSTSQTESHPEATPVQSVQDRSSCPNTADVQSVAATEGTPDLGATSGHRGGSVGHCSTSEGITHERTGVQELQPHHTHSTSDQIAVRENDITSNSTTNEWESEVSVRPRGIVGRHAVISDSDSDSDFESSPPVPRTGAGGRSSAMHAIEQNLAARRLQRVFRRRQEHSAQKEEEDMNLPRPTVKQTYRGHRNARTMIKQANFWGSRYVLSGSDCGHVFMWDRQSARLVMMLEADAHVVNCVQPHPFDPILATSGIDYDVKLWGPLSPEPCFDSEKADQIMQRNKVMLEETKDTLTVPASFMLRMLASINRVRAARRGETESTSDSEEDS